MLKNLTSMATNMLMGLCLLSIGTTAARADFSAAEKKELNAMIEAYVLANPEIVRQTLYNLAVKEADAKRAQAMSMLYDDAGDPYIGAGAEADIVIYEFSDYNCGYCKRIFTQLQDVLAEDPKVRLTLKEYPILAESSIEAARAAIAAQMQGKFEAFHIGMMTWRGAISTNSILSIAAEAGLDLDQLEADMKSPQIDLILARTQETARALEISGTPALMIGTEFIGGAISAAEIKQVIAEQRAANS